MRTNSAEQIFELYEQGELSRRQAISGLVAIGAAMAAGQSSTHGAENGQSRTATFRATGLDHVALDVADIARSRDFYVQHLGLKVHRQGEEMCFLGPDDGRFILALFRADEPKLNHYCYAIKSYDPDQVVANLKDVGIEPRRERNRVYFPDPDGITVQLASG